MNTKKLGIILIFAGAMLITQTAVCGGDTLPFYVYKDKKSAENHYAPSGWMGDIKSIFFSDGWPKTPRSGATCIKITYTTKDTDKQGWAGLYWQDPPNNWGNKKGGFDITGAKKLVFWVRGEKGGEVINDIFVGGIKGKYQDSCTVSIGPIDLTDKWQRFEISIKDYDLSRVSGGFGWSTSSASNPDGCTFYFDDIRYE